MAEIEDVRRTRAVQRAGRRKQGILDAPGLATVAVVGYTNAVSALRLLQLIFTLFFISKINFHGSDCIDLQQQGKSTLVSALSNTDLYRDDRYT